MVENAYKVDAGVGVRAARVCGLYWKRATNTQGALAAIVLGLATWIWLEIINPEGLVPPQLAGLAVSLAGMILGSAHDTAQPPSRATWRSRNIARRAEPPAGAAEFYPSDGMGRASPLAR